MNEKQQKHDIYEQITGAIIAAIEEGTATYEMPWHTLSTPINAATRKAYRGINTLTLWCIGRKRCYATQEWATYRQWSEMGAQVRRGERSASVVFWKFLESSDDAVEEVQESTATSRHIPLAREYHVFNAAQVEGYVPQPDWRLAESERITNAERFFNALPGVVKHGGDRAYYSSVTDEIQIPPFAQFKSAAGYYGTLGHEYTHWTGTPGRLSRDLSGRFGDTSYSMEELIAELGSAFLCADLGLGLEPRRDHAGYIYSWLSVLKGDKRALFTAASRAQKAAAYLEELQASPSGPGAQPADLPRGWVSSRRSAW